MRRHAKITLIVLAAIFGIACWAFRTPSGSQPPSAEKLSSTEKEEAVRFLEQALAASQEGSVYSGKQRFMKLAAEPGRRKTNNETFTLLRSIKVAPEAQWEAVRMKRDGEIGVLFRDERGAQISVVLQKKNEQLKVARAGVI